MSKFGLLAFASACVVARAAAAQSSPPPASGASSVSEVVVTGRFIASGAESATKQNVSTLDTPFSVSAYTNSFMTAIHTTQIADLYRYMTGLQKAGNTGYDLTLRGFSTSDSDRNTILVDELPGLAVRFGSPPTAGTDHVEVVKGAASLLYGAVQPGGFVNIVTKKPQELPNTVLQARLTTPGSDRDSRVEGGAVTLDSTGPTHIPLPRGELLYRLVGQISRDNTFRDNSYENGLYFLPSLTWKLGSKTSVTGEIEYRNVRSNYASLFLLAPRRPQGADPSILAPITTNYMSPTDYLYEQGLVETVLINHTFDNGVKWTFNFRNVNHRDKADAYDITRFDRKDPTFQTLDLRARGQRNRRLYTFGDTYFTLPFNTGPFSHRMIIGGSLGHEVDDFRRTQFCAMNSPDAPKADPTCNPTAAQYTVNFLNPDFSGVPALSSFGPGVLGPSTRNENYVSGTGSGVYTSDLITLSPNWKLSAGVRYAHEDQINFANKLVPGPQVGDARLVSSAVLPQVGLIFEPTHALSFYASYSTSFSPVPPGTQAPDGSYNFKPTTGDGYEAGVKTKLRDGRLTLTAAAFRIDQQNVIVPSSSSACSTGSCSDQVGGARSDGVEVEGTGQILPEWTVLVGYAHTNARIVSNPDAGFSGPLPGGQLQNSPKDAFHFWTRYDILKGRFQNLGFGLGYAYVSSRIAYSPTIALPKSFILPGYNVLDAALYYRFRSHYDFSAKINNLTDENFFSSGTVTQGKTNVQPGTPRTFLMTLDYTF